MPALSYKLGQRLSKIPFIKTAIDEKADLSAFDHKPSVRLIAGLLLIILSNALCWPSITAITAFSLYHKTPLLAAIGAPAIYATTFLANAAGMALSGGKYAKAFSRWLLRICVERLLAKSPPVPSPGTPGEG